MSGHPRISGGDYADENPERINVWKDEPDGWHDRLGGWLVWRGWDELACLASHPEAIEYADRASRGRMTMTLRANQISAQHIGHTINGTDIENTYFNGVLVGGDYTQGQTIHLVVGRQQFEVWLTQPITIETKEN